MGEGKFEREPLADMEGGAGEEFLEAWHEVAGDTVGVLVVRERSGLDTELIQHRLERLDSFRMGSLSLNWTSLSLVAGLVRVGRETEVAGRSLV